MPLQIAGIKIKTISIGEDDNGKEVIRASYQLLSDKGSTIGAKESLTSGEDYGTTKFVPAHDTAKALKAAVALYKRDVEELIGLTEPVKSVGPS